MKKFLLVAAMLIASPAMADVTVTNVHGTATGMGMARIVATMTSTVDDKLVGASVTDGRASVHTVVRKGPGSVMIPSQVVLRKNVARRLSVHGDHVMAMDLPVGIAKTKATLTFEKSPPVTVDVPIK